MQILPGKHHAMFKEIEDVKAFVLKKIKEHEQNLDFGDPKDFIDCFLIKLKQVLKAKFKTLWMFLFSYVFYLHYYLLFNKVQSLFCFFMYYHRRKHNPDTEFHKDNMLGTVLNLFIAGTETTSTTLRYALMLLIKHPHIQGMFKRHT